MSTGFSKEELERYSRHLIIPEFNIEGQRKLKEAKVLVIGTGGLGSPVLLYLAAAGIGHIGILDFDVVDDSNLQRQVLFSVDDVGKPKAEVAKARLEKLNPHIDFTVHNEKLTSENALEIISQYDLVADGTDNFPTRYLVNDACVILGKTNVYASIFRFEGQVSVFNYQYEDGTFGPNYRDLFPTPPPPGLVPSCAEGGVLGILPGTVGSFQANEVIKVISGIGEPLVGRLFLYDALRFDTRTLKIKKNPNTPKIEELIDYQQFCGIGGKEDVVANVKEISVLDLKKWREEEKDFQLIDVREPYEYDIANLDGELIPQKTVKDRLSKISSDRDVVIHCRSGKRSAEVIESLEEKGFRNLYNLKGGILAWANEIDANMAKY
ncbi:molybdopterin-synthase adenylyltransferase MoeB [Reichenbachiella versicolor]|uniref:molybdopterin-synthase adenylyltransferase MoeB n=1 Tax=Reichenbachiella versicolor TaxID=1821036 RepID=UPI000D6E2C8F|nr:molybdopterin-synthase adenylyltransferase MoeB [Reichenbachiella versicolor]